MPLQLAIPNVKRSIIDQETDEFTIGRVDNRLPRLRIAIAALCIRQGRSSYTELR
jgi:hypothetical protein